MKQYKGLYIDHVVFNSEADIDAFLEGKALEAYKAAVAMFVSHSDMEHSIFADEKAEILVNRFGYTWEQLEAIELEIMAAA